MRIGFSFPCRQELLRRLVPVLVTALAGFSCTRPPGELLAPPPTTDPLSRLFVGYGVVEDSYIRVSGEPGAAGASLGYLRRGSVVRILERRGPENREAGETWVLVDGTYRGWVQERAVGVYDNEARARTAAESMIR